jgi:hypothetical protein
LSWQDRQPQRHQALRRFLVDGIITTGAFLAAFEGSKEDARSALAAALSNRFQRAGVLPNDQA